MSVRVQPHDSSLTLDAIGPSIDCRACTFLIYCGCATSWVWNCCCTCKIRWAFGDRRCEILRGIADLHVRLWWSQDGESLFLQVWAALARLELEANRLGFILPLQDKALRALDVCRNNHLQAKGMVFAGEDDTEIVGEALAIGGKSEEEEEEEHQGFLCISPSWFYCLSCGFYTPRTSPYAHVYGSFRSQKRALFKYNPRMHSPIDPVTAIQLLYSIIESPLDVGGAFQNLDTKYANGINAVTHFPSHDMEELERIRASWSEGWFSWVGPIEDVHAYWGSELAYYTAFQRHFAVSLLLPTLIGAVLYGNQLADGGSPDSTDWTPLFGVIVAVACAVVFEQWRRQQAVHAMEWGTTDIAKRETLRPEYLEHCKLIRSPITGRPSYARSDTCLQFTLRGFSAAVVSMMIGVVIVLVLSIFFVRVFLVQLERDGSIQEGWGGNIAGIITAVQIQLMAYVYKSIARIMTDLEGHSTDRMYQNSYVAKTVVFTFINDFYSLFWIAFVKPAGVEIFGERQVCKSSDIANNGPPDCMGELQSQLASILIVRLVIGNLQEIVLPVILPQITAFFSYTCAKPDAKAKMDETRARAPEKPLVEREADLPEFEPSSEYLELFELFGYAYLFLPAWPLASLVALVSAVVEMWVDTSKLIRQTRRIRPLNARDIGVWIVAFESLAIIAVATNLGVVLFTSNTGFFQLAAFETRLQVFIGVEHLLVGGVILFKYLIPDTPTFVAEHLERQLHLVDKHVEGKNEAFVVDGESRLVDVDSDPEQALAEWRAVRSTLAKLHGVDAETPLSMEEIKTIGRSPAWESDPPTKVWSVSLYNHGPLPPGVDAIAPAVDGAAATIGAASSNPIAAAKARTEA